jgi:hypothetical protein
VGVSGTYFWGDGFSIKGEDSNHISVII